MPEALRADARIGPYDLLRRLGGGGMGDVYLARSRGGRLVAVKVVRPHLAQDPGFRRRFRAEVEAARKVGGFYTAPVVDADPEAGTPWLATAYIPGPSLQEAVAAFGPLPVGNVTALGAGLAEGLAAIHACGLVHRDLKPGNVILAEDGPRIIDFGIARALDASPRLTTHGVIGTPAFMSPEQVRDGQVGPRSDVFSLASLLAHAVTGRTPFGDGTTFAVLHRVVYEDPDLTGVPPALAALLLPCLEKDPAHRPTAPELLDRFAAATQAYDPAARRNPDEVATMIVRRGALMATLLMPQEGTDASDTVVRKALLGDLADAMGALFLRRADADGVVPVRLPPLAGELAGAGRVTLTRWHRRPGDTVGKGEALCSVTDGRTRASVVAPVDGQLRQVGPELGRTVVVGDVLGLIQPTPTPTPIPVSTPASGKSSGLGLLKFLGGVLAVAFIFYNHVDSRDIFGAKAGDCIRVEDGGKGSGYVQSCQFPVPWDQDYKVVSVNSTTCLSASDRVLVYASTKPRKSISICARRISVWD
ncbi:protein kinase [Streptomyces sp. NPDC091280]|uniref:protein kinase domain-containing protein n=1 Tax=Streptomyces sp. NPDC091280 TaxID=3365984 RepID=UPI0037F37B96